MDNEISRKIIEFAYDYQTLDADVIRQAVPDADVYTAEEVHEVIQEDYERMSRVIEHSTVHPDYQRRQCVVYE